VKLLVLTMDYQLSVVKLSNLEDVEESPKIEWELMAPHVNLKQAANLNLKFVKTHLKRQ